MAIRDQSYTRYDGPLRDKGAWAVIGWSGLRTYWRFWRTKLTLLAVWLVPFIFGLLVIAEYALSTQLGNASDAEPGAGPLAFYVGVQVFSLALVYIANGCGIVADDLRHRTIQLYFSKPISRVDYAVGKYLTLLWLAFFSVVLPTLLLAGLRTAFYLRADQLADLSLVHLKAVGVSLFVFATIAAMVIGLSSLTRRTGYAVLAFIALLLIPMILHAIIAVTTDGSELAALLSFPGTVNLAITGATGGAEAMPDGVPLWAPFAVLTGLFSAGIGALAWRVSKLEGIA